MTATVQGPSTSRGAHWADEVVRYPAELIDRYRREGHWGNRTIGAELRRTAARFPDTEALVTAERRVTYRELDERSDAIAQRLLDAGLAAGDRVILQIGNTAEALESFYALLKMGAIPICSLVPFGHHEIDAIAGIAEARAHLVQIDLPGPDLVAFAREVRAEVPSMELILTLRGDGGPDTHRIDDAPALRAPLDSALDGGDPDAVAVMQLSGGTTGTPKLIPRLHAEYWYNGLATAQRYGIDHGDRVGHFMPLVHNLGIHGAVFSSHSVGATLVLGTWSPDEVLRTLREERVTFAHALTTLAPTICDHPDFAASITHLKRFGLAVPAVPADLFDKLMGLGFPVFQFYGMSEGFVCSMALDAPLEMRKHTVGHPLSAADEFRIVDPETGVEVQDGQPGELCVRGPYTLRGYFRAAEHNRKAFTPDGFLRTGDLVQPMVIGGKVSLQIQGRHKDLVSRGGEKINAEEIEILLRQFPGVREAALVGMPDPRLGERPCAFVVTADGKVPDLEAVKEFLSGRGVAKFKWPERLEVIDELPVTHVGKVSKKDLRDLLAQRLSPPERMTSDGSHTQDRGR